MNDKSGMTVSELNLMVAEAIRKDPRMHSVTVHGEISGFRHHIASGHWYFALKDDESAVNCVMFRQNTLRVQKKPRDGDAIVVSGYMDVYPKNGTYQLYVMSIRSGGIGDLYIRFEELKQRLNAEGLFDPSRKQPLPMVPRKVAIVTSASGAALHDILNVSAMRNPSVPIVLIPVTVQGEHAASEIAAGIRNANEQTDADVLIVARGGGSAEDLWSFNEEIVARAVASSRIPVVSGVGHEIDTTICDLTADVRASTPSNAAEIVFPDRRELRSRVKAMALGLQRAATARVSLGEAEMRKTAYRLGVLNPIRRIAELTARSGLYRGEIVHALRNSLEAHNGSIQMIRTRLQHAIRRRMDAAVARNTQIRERLEGMNPMSILDRGYAIVFDTEGRVLTQKAQALEARELTVRFGDGTVKADVQPEGNS